ncbi:MAG: aldehyde dehydrogenase family protein, partial [Beijerinckiaceae bacterium]
MTDTLKTVSPVDGRIYVERPLATAADIDRALGSAQRAQRSWRAVPLAERCAVLGRAVDAFVAKSNDIAAEITWQMGRPIRHSPGEIRGFEERARYMLGVAPEALASIQPGPKPGFQRQIKRVPLGVVAVVAPWNYPYLTAVNAVLPALIAGNSVVLKASHQTPLCAERFFEAFASAGVPAGVFQYLHLSHADTARLLGDGRVASVCFTGSVSG